MESAVPAGSTTRAGRISTSGGRAGTERVSFPGLPVPAASQPSKPAHRSGAEADPGYAPPQSQPGHGGTVAPAAPARLYPTSREPYFGSCAKWDLFPTAGTQSSLQAQALRADDLSRSAGSGRCESRSAQAVSPTRSCVCFSTPLLMSSRVCGFWPPIPNKPPIPLPIFSKS